MFSPILTFLVLTLIGSLPALLQVLWISDLKIYNSVTFSCKEAALDVRKEVFHILAAKKQL